MVKRDYARIGETVFEETLENGLRVFVFPKPEFGKYYAFFATRYGGMDTRFQKNGQWLDTPMGIAHYLEHKMFDTPDGGTHCKHSPPREPLPMLLPVRRSPDITLSARISFGTICGPCWSLFRFPILPRKVWTKSRGSLGRKSA